jgi:ribosomal protein L7/L12
MKRKLAWGNFFGILLVVFCGQEIAHRIFGSIGWSLAFGNAIITGYSLGLILIGMSSSAYLPRRMTERLYALEAKIARLTATPLPEGQTEFTVTLEEYPADKKIAIVKVIRETTGLGIREAKDLIEDAPSTIKKDISKADAEAIIKKFDETGAKVEIK